MKSPATKYFFVLVLCLFGLSTLKCDNLDSVNAMNAQTAPTAASNPSSSNDQLISQVSEKANADDNSSDFTFRFPNIFDVFRSLF